MTTRAHRTRAAAGQHQCKEAHELPWSRATCHGLASSSMVQLESAFLRHSMLLLQRAQNHKQSNDKVLYGDSSDHKRLSAVWPLVPRSKTCLTIRLNTTSEQTAGCSSEVLSCFSSSDPSLERQHKGMPNAACQ